MSTDDKARIQALLDVATEQQQRYQPGDEAREYWTGQVDVLTLLLHPRA